MILEQGGSKALRPDYRNGARLQKSQKIPPDNRQERRRFLQLHPLESTHAATDPETDIENEQLFREMNSGESVKSFKPAGKVESSGDGRMERTARSWKGLAAREGKGRQWFMQELEPLEPNGFGAC